MANVNSVQNQKSSIQINGKLVIFSKFFTDLDTQGVLIAIPEGTTRVVFIDTPATAHLVATVEALMSEGKEVVVRDHHDVPNPENPREEQIAEAAGRVRELVGSNAKISNRKEYPACSSLIKAGEFNREGTVIVADTDPDGLTASMKALGVTYPELDSDADVLDGSRAGQTEQRLSKQAFLLTRAMATLPPFNPQRPQILDDARAKLFGNFVAMVQGDSKAEATLQEAVKVFNEGVLKAEQLAEAVEDIVTGVSIVDVTEAPRFDMGTLARLMENRDVIKVTVQKKSVGPIAAKHNGIQYSLAVSKIHQKDVNLQDFLEAGFESSPESGIISNTTFLLHVSEEVWNSQVLPALKNRFS